MDGLLLELTMLMRITLDVAYRCPLLMLLRALRLPPLFIR